jgi:15-hydroxyprostaglandin dehydrogenase (NAD)
MKTAIVSGGCSGIGLALVRHLLEKEDQRYRVAIADIDSTGYEKRSGLLDPKRTLFIHTNVADWDSNAALFKKVYEWKSNGASDQKIDFFAANAGTTDKEQVRQAFDLDAEPQRPALIAMEVDFTSVMYGLKLFIHYARKSKRDLRDSDYHPKMVVTASCVGLYPFPIAPEYAAAKAACVNLTRSVGDALLKHDDIAVNAICPAFVPTNIIPKALLDMWPPEFRTPTSTIMRAYDELIDATGRVKQDGKSNGVDGEVKTSECVECSIDQLYYRKPVPPPDAGQKFLNDEAIEGGVWEKGVAAAMEQGQMAHRGL